MKLDEKKIQYHLSWNMLRRGHDIAVPNVDWSWLYWEADLITITKAGYMHEFEIKISLQDFRADFKKPKHRTFRRGVFRNNRYPNYFTYVAPIAAMPICIPDHAGIIEVSETGRYGHDFELRDIKKAPLLHRHKQTNSSKVRILRTFMYKYWKIAEELNSQKLQRELFK